MKRIIFLDVDGVLNSVQSKSLFALAKRPLRLLSQIVEATEAEIVLSSTWRLHGKALKKVTNTLGYRGLKIIGSTPDLSADWGEHSGPQRGYEIAAWLDEHHGVDRYVILDDLFPDDFLASQRRCLIQTSMATGLTEIEARRAIDLLLR